MRRKFVHAAEEVCGAKEVCRFSRAKQIPDSLIQVCVDLYVFRGTIALDMRYLSVSERRVINSDSNILNQTFLQSCHLEPTAKETTTAPQVVPTPTVEAATIVSDVSSKDVAKDCRLWVCQDCDRKEFYSCGANQISSDVL